jgi:hypothetical protein
MSEVEGEWGVFWVVKTRYAFTLVQNRPNLGLDRSGLWTVDGYRRMI